MDAACSTRSGRTALVLFTRAPEREGKAFGLGRRVDRRLAECLVERTLQTLAAALSADASVALVTDGALSEERLAVLRAAGAEPLELRQQGAGFEERFLGALEAVAALGFDRIVAIGSDTPELSAQDLRRALEAEPQGVVIGPSVDGGFYLLGLPCCLLGVLRGLPWRRPSLLSELLLRLARLEVQGLFLPPRRDVDHARDVRRMWPLLMRLVGGRLRLALAEVLQEGWISARRCSTPRLRFARRGAPCRAPPRPAPIG